MRKLIALVAVVGVVSSLGAAPAVAGKKKKPVKVNESFGADLLPFPKDENWAPAGFVRPGCTSGEEGVHWVAQEFTAPGKGTLRFYMEGFDGDHDIYILDGDMPLYRGDQAQVGAGLAPPEEEISAPLKKGDTVMLVACNWLGEPAVEAHYEGTFK